MIRLVYSIPLWIGFIFLVFLPLYLIGLIMIPLALVFKAYEMTDLNLSKPADGPIYHFTWKIMKVWDNWEDGIANRNYRQYDSMFKQVFYWTIIRNPVNNLRIIKYLSCDVKPEKIRYKGSFSEADIQRYKDNTPHWFFCWHGIYACYFANVKVFGQLRRIWIGWKLLPQDKYGNISYYRSKGAGFAIQFKRID